MKMRFFKVRGFTFIEIEIALLVFLLAILTVVAFAPVGLRSMKLGEKHTQAMNYARHLMEFTRALSFDYQTSVPYQELTSAIIPGVQQGYYFEVKVDALPENAKIKRIEVDIYWKDYNVGGAMATKIYQLVSYSANVP